MMLGFQKRRDSNTLIQFIIHFVFHESVMMCDMNTVIEKKTRNL